MTSINLNGGTVLIRDLTVSGNIEYNLNNAGWVSINNIVNWPVTITNTGAPTIGKILFTTDILMNLGSAQYFICGASHLQFGDTSLTSGGTRPIITISGLGSYDGLIRNGTNLSNAYNNVVILNLKLVMLNSSLANSGGWLCQAYFGKASSNNKIVHCTSDWTGPGNSLGTSCGGVVGQFSQNLTVTYCYTFGDVNNISNGNVIANSALSVVTDQCFSTGTFSGVFSTSGGIFASEASNCTATKCYNLGGGTGGGIYGPIPNIAGRCYATNCYSRGPINTSSSGIANGTGFSAGPIITASNCYSSGSMFGATPGTTGGIIGVTAGPLTNYIATQCYSSGLSSGPPGIGGGIYVNTNADNLIVGQNNYAEANHGNSGNWIDNNTIGILLGIGTIWYSLSPNTPYILLHFGTTPYLLQNIDPVTYSIIQTKTFSIDPSGTTTATVATGYSLFSIIQGGHPSIAINPLTGVISTNNTPGGTYTLTIYGQDATSPDIYTTTTVVLEVPFPPVPPPTIITKACRFCYSYKPPGITGQTWCEPPVCTTNSTLSSLASLPPVVNNSSRTSEQSLLLRQQQLFLEEVNANQVASTVQSTILNSTLITNTLYGQILQVQQDRFLPYRPYVPPVIPSSVMELQMATVNVGVPHSFFTIMDCKGSQSVTT